MSRHDQEVMWSDFRVGIITLIALALLILGVVFAGGDKGLLFQKKSFVQALMANVGGLKKGSSVTMAGMTIGKVNNIAFVDHAEGSQIQITMQVRTDIRSKIKSDSVPSIRTQGMLGDRYVDISTGSNSTKPLADDGVLIGKAATDFDETLHQALGVLQETEKLLNSINRQQGTVGQLFYDERFYNNLVNITEQLKELIDDFKKHPRKYVKFSMF